MRVHVAGTGTFAAEIADWARASGATVHGLMDDAMRPDCLERLLGRAREDRLEAVSGRAEVHRPGEEPFAIGSFPPRLGHFSWAGRMVDDVLADPHPSALNQVRPSAG